PRRRSPIPGSRTRGSSRTAPTRTAATRSGGTLRGSTRRGAIGPRRPDEAGRVDRPAAPPRAARRSSAHLDASLQTFERVLDDPTGSLGPDEPGNERSELDGQTVGDLGRVRIDLIEEVLAAHVADGSVGIGGIPRDGGVSGRVPIAKRVGRL